MHEASVPGSPEFYPWSAVLLIQKPGTVIVLSGRNLRVIPLGAGHRARIDVCWQPLPYAVPHCAAG